MVADSFKCLSQVQVTLDNPYCIFGMTEDLMWSWEVVSGSQLNHMGEP